MSVQKRITSRGETPEYHYKFMSGGKFFFGVCEGCYTKKAAEEYESEIKKKVKDLAKQKSIKALVENFKQELTGGIRIDLANAYELSLNKPRRRQPTPGLVAAKRSYWRDFTSFIKKEYPDVHSLSDVKKIHAESYIQFLRENGRFDKIVNSRSGKKKVVYSLNGNLSPRTVNVYHQTISEVFDKLSGDAGLSENPFRTIPRLNNNSESREAFSEDELFRIWQHFTPFTEPIFTIGINTALREGDICTLRWGEVDLHQELISKRMLKTGSVVEIPIMPPLKSFLVEQQKKTGTSEFVLPEHASMYLNNPSGISYRVKLFLEGLGIKTTKKVPGRTRAVSIKDVHSLRHSLCYYAGIYGVPLVIVQSIVGHMTPEMTTHYSAHASREAKREKLKLMDGFMKFSTGTMLPQQNDERERLKKLAESADIEKVRDCLKIFQ